MTYARHLQIAGLLHGAAASSTLGTVTFVAASLAGSTSRSGGLQILTISLTVLAANLFWLRFAYAITKGRYWATHGGGFLISLLALAIVPFGTVAGAHSLWLLMRIDRLETTAMESRRAAGVLTDSAAP